VRLTYKHVSKLIDLLEKEIETVDTRKGRNIATLGKIASPLAGEDEFLADESRKFDRETSTLAEILNILEEELNKVSFTFAASGFKNNQQDHAEEAKHE